MVTLHVTLLPPPLTMPLHWLTVETGRFDCVVVVVQPAGGSTPAAVRHTVVMTVDCVPPWGVRVFTMVTLQFTSNPAPVGNAGGLHWLTVGAAAATTATKGLERSVDPTEDELVAIVDVEAAGMASAAMVGTARPEAAIACLRTTTALAWLGVADAAGLADGAAIEGRGDAAAEGVVTAATFAAGAGAAGDA